MAELPTATEVAALIDHALLVPDLTRKQLAAGCMQASELGLFSVCVQPSNVQRAVQLTAGTGVKVGTVIGFPHGATTPEVKVFEAERALRGGAVELDMVLNIGRLIGGELQAAQREVEAVVRAAHAQLPVVIVKVILETAYLSDDQIVVGAQAAEAAGADFVKTSTGFAGGGATARHLHLMRQGAPSARLKASGGVRDLRALLAMVDAGASRIGTSASAAIIEELEALRRGDSYERRSVAGAY